MHNQIPHPMSSPNQNLSKNTMRYVKNMNKKVLFFMTNMSIQPLWLTHFIEILLVLEFQLTKTYFGMFYYKAHFRPQISSNGSLIVGIFCTQTLTISSAVTASWCWNSIQLCSTFWMSMVNVVRLDSVDIFSKCNILFYQLFFVSYALCRCLWLCVSTGRVLTTCLWLL